MLDDEAAMRFIRRRAAFQLGMMERLVEKCKDHLDFIWLGEDLGTQIAPMISLELYRAQIKPIHKTFVDLASITVFPLSCIPAAAAVGLTKISSKWACAAWIPCSPRL
ncbi:MAG: hypothetical protein ACLRTQ_02205 [Candidatus Borkfalkia sp.]